MTSSQIPQSWFRHVIVPDPVTSCVGDNNKPIRDRSLQSSLEVEGKPRRQAWKIENLKMRKETGRSQATRCTYKYNQSHHRPLIIFMLHSVTERRVTPCVPQIKTGFGHLCSITQMNVKSRKWTLNQYVYSGKQDKEVQ